MIIPDKSAFAAWDAGQIGTEDLECIEAFFLCMLTGAEALGPRYSLATMALRAEHNGAHAMLSRRKEPRNPYTVTSLVGPGGISSVTLVS